jgi:pimeloyl-ACP methyl ester carboxylesterase
MSFDPSELDLKGRLLDSAEFLYTARHWNARVRLTSDDVSCDLVVQDGKPVSYGAGGDEPADVVISGPAEEWDLLLAKHPDCWHTHLTMFGAMEVQGDVVAHLGAYGPAVDTLVRTLRAMANGEDDGHVEPMREPFRDTDVTVGRYIYYEVDGVEYRVYYETAGAGTPLMLQHTAGADSRQWRHLLADPQMQASYQMFAYDLPFHGRSLPPLSGGPWWTADYAPTKQWFHDHIVAIKRTLELDRPTFMGCSVGGALAPEMVAHFPDEFRGAVSLNGTYYTEGAAFNNDYHHHPRINGDDFAWMVYDYTSPSAPEPTRRETTWIYATSGPAVYKGDNQFYMNDHDLRVDGHLIDTSRTPLYIAVGEHDPSSMGPGGSPDIAANVPGAKFALLPGLSHFMMSDDPVRFNATIKPILDEVAEDARAIEAAAAYR